MSKGSGGASVEREARHSATLAWATRLGLVGYGFVHLLVAWIAIRVAIVGGGGSATGTGALAQLTHDTFGLVTLALLAVGFAGLALWQFLTAAVGYRDLDGWRRPVMRLGAVARVVVYGYFAVASARLLFQHGSGKSPRVTTAIVLAQPGGSLILVGAGVVAAAVGVGLVVFGVSKQFLDQLDEEARSADRRHAIVVVGQVGYVSKGLAFMMIGALLGWAAFTQNPRKVGGLDQAFSKLLGSALGGPAVVVAGLGIGCFGLYLFARARHLDTHALTS
ncbi:MAG: DUF1206 domain-containing protein [Nocardioidaceae bacterium]